jgi:hypothetical protein
MMGKDSVKQPWSVPQILEIKVSSTEDSENSKHDMSGDGVSARGRSIS